ncbi:MAG: ATP-binding protein [Euryarchaeota archaeon]|nr:ATP-binding protein [Euryarchaeota archaeon]
MVERRQKGDENLGWLLAQNEGQHIEFKQSASDNLGKTICGFANSTGGRIYNGVWPAGAIGIPQVIP